MAKRRKKATCPICKVHLVTYVALQSKSIGEVDDQGNDVVTEAHRYSVCQRCYLDQYAVTEGEMTDPPYDLDPAIAAEKGVPAYVEAFDPE